MPEKTRLDSSKPKPDAVQLANQTGITLITRQALEDFEISLTLGQLVKMGFAFKHGGGWGDLPPEELKELIAIVQTMGFVNSEYHHDYLIKKDYYERFGSTDVITMPVPEVSPQQEDDFRKQHERLAKFYADKQKPK